MWTGRRGSQDETGANETDLTGWWSEHPSADIAVAGAAIAAHVCMVQFAHHGDWLGWVEASQRQAMYAGAVGMIAILGGLSSIGLAIYQGSDGERVRALRSLYGAEMRRNWRALLTITGIGALACLVAIGANRSGDPAFTRFWVEGAIGLWLMRYGRLIWLFNKVLAIRDLDVAQKDRPPAPKVDPGWPLRRSS
jgi:hypothetical protein